MKLQPGFVHECALELLALWARGEIDPVVGARFPLDEAGAAHALIAERKHVGQGRPRAVKALVTGGEGGIGRAIVARLEAEGYDVESLDLVDGFDVTDRRPRGSRSGPVDLACLNAGVLTGETDLRALTDEEYRRAVGVNVDGVVFGVRRLAQVMDEGAIVVTASLAGLDRNAARRDLLADEARARRVRAQRRAAARAGDDQRGLPRDRRHADDRRTSASAFAAAGFPLVAPEASRRGRVARGHERRERGRAGSCSRGASRRRSASRTCPARGRRASASGCRRSERAS